MILRHSAADEPCLASQCSTDEDSSTCRCLLSTYVSAEQVPTWTEASYGTASAKTHVWHQSSH